MPKFETLEDWIEKVWKSQEALGDKVGVARNTVSQWMNGKSRIRQQMREKLKKLGYDGPWPDSGGDLNREDLQALGRDLIRTVDQSEARIAQQIRDQGIVLGAVLQEILKRLPPIGKNLPVEP